MAITLPERFDCWMWSRSYFKIECGRDHERKRNKKKKKRHAAKGYVSRQWLRKGALELQSAPTTPGRESCHRLPEVR